MEVGERKAKKILVVKCNEFCVVSHCWYCCKREEYCENLLVYAVHMVHDTLKVSIVTEQLAINNYKRFYVLFCQLFSLFFVFLLIPLYLICSLY